MNCRRLFEKNAIALGVLIIVVLSSVAAFASAQLSIDPAVLTQTQDKNLTFSQTLTLENSGDTAVDYDFTFANITGPVYYTWSDSNSPTGPTYVWNDISTTGALLENIQWSYVLPVTLNFQLPFYGQLFDTIYVAEDGFITLGEPYYDSSNSTLPSTYAPANLIAGFHDDLYFDTNSKVYVQNEANRVIIQYDHLVKSSDTSEKDITFQIILDVSGTITYYYNQMTATLTSATVGLQNATQDEGIEVIYNAPYLASEMALQFTMKPDWIHISSEEGQILPAEPALLPVFFDSNAMAAGTYTVDILLSHTATNIANPLTIPCSLTVNNLLPSAVITGLPVSLLSGDAFSLSGTTSTDADGAIVSYLWDFDGNGITDAEGEVAEHTFTLPGSYTTCLTVIDEDGGVGTASVVITVANRTPTAVGSFAPQLPEPEQQITFDGTASSDLDGTVSSYLWDLDGDYQYDDASEPVVTHTFTSTGTFNVGLMVIDDCNAAAVSRISVVVRSDWPELAVSSSDFVSTGTVGNLPGQTLNIGNVGGSLLEYSIKPVYTSYAVVGGPDQSGYTWTDSDRSALPFEWNDISLTGTKINNSSTHFRVTTPLDFTFPFYNDLFDSVTIDSGGYLTFRNSYSGYEVLTTLPTTLAPDLTIAGLFIACDLSRGGGIYFLQENDRFTVQYEQVHDRAGTGTFTYQIVLMSDGAITLYYKELLGDYSQATVGLNRDYSRGLLVTHGDQYLKNQFAVQIGKEPTWAQVSPLSGTLNPGANENIALTVDTAGLSSSSYTLNLELTHNASNQPNPLIIPWNITVENTAPVAEIQHDRAYTGYPVTLDASYSTDIDGKVTGYAWCLDNDNVFDDGIEPTLTHTFEAGSHTVSLKVTDDDLETAVQTITINPVDPPQIVASPLALTSSLLRGDSVDSSVTLQNTGPSDLNFAIGLANPGGVNTYLWADSNHVGGPQYVWNDISSTGTRLNIPDLSMAYEGIDLSFDFPFYGKQYRRVNVSTNGYITLGYGNGSTDDWPYGAFPYSYNPEYIISAFFAALVAVDGGGIYYLDDGEQLVVQYSQMKTYWGSSTENYTFQIVLNKHGVIALYYNTVNGPAYETLIGIQSDTTTGLTVAYNRDYLTNGLAVQIANIPVWLEAGVESGVVAANSTQVIPLQLSSAGYAAGTYTGTLLVYHDDPLAVNPVTVACTVEVLNNLPVAQISYSPVLPKSGETVIFDGAGSTDLDGSVVKYEWDFNNDSIYDAEGASVSYIYTTSGEKTIGLRVTDSDSGISTGSITVTIDNALPVAQITATPASPDPGQLVTLDGSLSTDLDGTIVSYAWNLDGGDSYDDGTDPVLTTTFAAAGSYTVGLQVTDNTGASAVTSLTLEVDNWPKLVLDPLVLNLSTTVDTPLTSILTIGNTAGIDLGFTLTPYYEGLQLNGSSALGSYHWADSDSSEPLAYQWNDISTTGTRLVDISDNGQIYQEVSLSCPFNFYNQQYSSINVTRYGYLALETTWASSINRSLPSSEYKALIAGFWDDLGVGAGGGIYYQDNGNQFIIQYTNMTKYYNSGTFTFQIILERDGDIYFIYKEMSGVLNSATVGIQNTQRDDELQIAYNAEQVKSNYVVKILPLQFWLEPALTSGTVPAGQSLPLTLGVQPAGLKSQVYQAALEISHNANNAANPAVVPVTLTVNNLAPVAEIQYGIIYSGYPVTFDASSATDYDGYVASYAWCLNDDNLFNDGGGKTVTRTFNLPGSYQISLKLVDDDGMETIKTVTVDVISPPMISVSPSTLTATLPKGVTGAQTLTITNPGQTPLEFSVAGAITQSGVYHWIDSTEPGGPQYVWNDISATGIHLQSLSTADNASAGVPLSFNFPFYSYIFNQMYIATNGLITFYTDNSNGNNTSLPTTSAWYAVAPFWDDLKPVAGGNIYYLDNGKQVIVQYDQIAARDGDLYTFQVVLDQNGNITFYYNSMTGVLNSASIGIQLDWSQGLQVVYNEDYVTDGLAVQIWRSPVTAPAEGIVQPDTSMNVDVNFVSHGYLSGTYSGTLNITHNAPNTASPIQIPCTLTVTNLEPTALASATPATVYSGESIVFDASGSADQDGTLVNYLWDLDNDGEFTDASGLTIQHSFPDNGNYLVGLKVVDNEGAYATTTVSVTILNSSPVAVISANPVKADPDQLIVFDGSGSSDLDGSIVSYAWDLDNDNIFEDGALPEVTASFSDIGVHTIGLEVTDDEGASTRTTYSFEIKDWPKLTITPEAVEEVLLVNQTAARTITFTNSGLSDVELAVEVPQRMGPDQFGHYWTDSDLLGTTYEWNDIRETGTRLTQADSAYWPEQVNLSFAFPFYGQQYNSIYVNPNGYLTLYSSSTDQTYSSLPGTGSPANLIAAFFTNLEPNIGGDIYFLDDGTKAIIQYSEVVDAAATGTFTFQIVLERTGAITFFYNAMTGDCTSAVVGIQNSIRTDGLEIAYNTPYVKSGHAVRIDFAQDWLEVAALPVTILPAGAELNLDLHINTTGLLSDVYQRRLRVIHNASTYPEPYILPVLLTVSNTAPTAYINYLPQAPFIGGWTRFDASASSDPDGYLTGYRWDLNNDGDFSDASGSVVEHMFTTTGSYPVAVEVVDDDGAVSVETVTITVGEPPQITVNPTNFSQTLFRGNSASALLTVSNPGGTPLEIKLTANAAEASEYIWEDSDQTPGPLYVWKDISTGGTLLTTISNADDANQEVSLSFGFPFFENTYNKIYVSSNGYVTLNAGSSQYSNYPLPSISAPAYLIAAFMDDLNPGTGGDIYYLDEGNRVIVQFEQVKQIGGSGTYTFQIVLNQNGGIYFYYKEMVGTLNSATIGIQDGTKTRGLTVVNCLTYVKDEHAIRFFNRPTWLEISPEQASVAPGQSVDISLIFSATADESNGLKTAGLNIAHNVPGVLDNPLVIPCTLEVINTPPTASFTESPQPTYTGEVMFDASGSTDDAGIASYAWDLDGNGLYDDATGVTVPQTFAANGTYDIGLEVTDSDGVTATLVKTITILNRLPEAVATSSLVYPEVGQSITFSAAGSTDPDGTITEYTWDLNGDEVYGDATGETVSYIFETEGEHIVRLKVIDDDHAEAAVTITVNVANWPKIILTPAAFAKTMNSNGLATETLNIANTGGLDLTYSLTNLRNPLSGQIDQFGNSWIDSDEESGPVYVWNDISTTGTLLTNISNALDAYQAVDLSFSFPFYGSSYMRMFVGSNGYITFGTASTDYSNSSLPGTGSPANLIAGFFDDLYPGSGGDIYYLDDGAQVIVQFEQVKDYSNTGTFTFQMVLHQDGTIYFYYKDMNGSVTSSTVGIQNSTWTDGLTLAYNQAYLKNELAIRIKPVLRQVMAEPLSGVLAAGTNQSIQLTFDTTGYDLGTYEVLLNLEHSGVNTINPILIPVTFTIDNLGADVVLTSTPASPYTGSTITLDASGSTDPDGTIVSYEWDLDNDGEFDDAAGVTATTSFAKSGTYLARIRVTDDQNGVVIRPIKLVVLNRAPTGTINGLPGTVRVNDLITLDASGSSDPDGTIVSYAWDLNMDGVFDDATGPVITHTFTQMGTHWVRVQITDDENASITRILYFTVYTALPVAAIAYTPELPYSNEEVTFDASASTDSDGAIVSYEWDLDNDGWYDDGTTAQVTKVFTSPATYTVRVQVRDDQNASDTETITVTVQNLAPTAVITTTPENPYTYQQITLSAADSSDPDGTGLTYAWDVDNNGVYDNGTDSTKNVSYADDGTYTVGLKVTDAYNAEATVTVNLNVANRVPVPEIEYSPSNVVAGDPVAFSAAASTDSDGTIVSYDWDMDNDGIYADAAGAAVTWTFTDTGVFTVGLKVTDDDSAESTTTTAVHVADSLISDLQVFADLDGINLSWRNPETPFDQVVVVRKAGAYPTAPTDGAVIYEGTGTALTDQGLADGVYYYTVYPYVDGIAKTPAQGSAALPGNALKHVLSYQAGDGSLFSTTYTGQNWRRDNYTDWNSSLVIGRSYDNNACDLWIQFPDLVGFNAGQIPQNQTTIDRATLFLTVEDFEPYMGVVMEPLQLSIYQISDPDSLGAPYFGHKDGIATGLTFQYRDQRLNRTIPWKTGAENILDLLNGLEPVDTIIISPDDYQRYPLSAISFDVTSALQAWAAGEPNQGFFITATGKWDESRFITFYGPDAEVVTNRPRLEVVHTAYELELVKPATLSEVRAVAGDGTVSLTWDNTEQAGCWVKIVRKAGYAPANPYDGELVFDGYSNLPGERLDTGLTNGTPYYYALFTYDADRTYSPGSALKVVPGTAAAPVPNIYAMTGEISVTFHSVSDATNGYTIYRKSLDSGKIISRSISQFEPSEYYQSGIADWNIEVKEYSYWVVSRNAYGEGQPSEVITIVPVAGGTVPNVPFLQVTSSDPKEAYLTWPNETGVGAFVLERREVNGEWSVIARPEYTGFYRDKSVQPGTAYEYRLKAVNTAGESAYSGTATYTSGSAVTGLQWNAVSATQINLSWAGTADASGYVVKVLNEAWEYVTEQYVYGETAQVTRLTPGKGYYMVVYVMQDGIPRNWVMTPLIRTSADPKQDLF